MPPAWIEEIFLLEYADELTSYSDGQELLDDADEWADVDDAVDRYRDRIHDRISDWFTRSFGSETLEQYAGKDLEAFYDDLLDPGVQGTSRDGFSIRNLEQGEPLNCVGRAVSGAIVAEMVYDTELIAVSQQQGGVDETGVSTPRAHVLLEDADGRRYGVDHDDFDEEKTGIGVLANSYADWTASDAGLTEFREEYMPLLRDQLECRDIDSEHASRRYDQRNVFIA